MPVHENRIAFDFVFDYLHPLPLRVRPLFGCHAVYHEDKILLILRMKSTHTESNGIWMATSREHHASLETVFPGLASVDILNDGKGETQWRMLRADDVHFETDAIRLCEMIRNGDPRIGKIPKARKKSKRVRPEKGR